MTDIALARRLHLGGIAAPTLSGAEAKASKELCSQAVSDLVTVIFTESRCFSTMFKMPRTRASNNG